MDDALRLDFAEKYALLAEEMFGNGKIALSQHYCEQSLKYVETPQIRNFLAATLHKQGDIEGAILACESVIDRYPNYGNALNDLGAYLLDRNPPHLRRAVELFQRAINTDNFQFKHFAHRNMGKAYELSGKPQDAFIKYRDALAVKPDFELARKDLIRVQDRLDQPSEERRRWAK